MHEGPIQSQKPRDERSSEVKRPGLRQAILAALTASNVLVGVPESANAKGHTLEEASYTQYEQYYRDHEELTRRWMLGSPEQRRSIGKSNPAFALNQEVMSEAFEAEENSKKARARQLVSEYQLRHKTLIQNLERIDRTFSDKKMVEASLQNARADFTDDEAARYAIDEAHALELWKEIAPFTLMFTPDEIDAFKEYPNVQSLGYLRGMVERMDEFLSLEHSLRDRAMIKYRLEGSQSFRDPGFGGPEQDRG